MVELPQKNDAPPIRLAICGIRGIPARYGGFETFAEELSKRLLGRDYAVTVFCRTDWAQQSKALKEYNGVSLRHLAPVKQKYLETPLHTLFSLLQIVFFGGFDIVLVCNAANAPFLWLLKIRGIPVAINLDGIERRRAKWNALGRLWYRFGEWCSTRFADDLISDAEVIREYYLERFKAPSKVICYGYKEIVETEVVEKVAQSGLSPAVENCLRSSEIHVKHKLRGNDYLLYVSRLEPENNAHIAIEAYLALPSDLRRMPLVVVGDAPYAVAYKASLRERVGDNPNVIFTGFQFEMTYWLLQLGAYAYIQATEVGGTHPALVEAMGFGNAIVANDTPEHHEVLSDAGIYYQFNDAIDLSRCLSEFLVRPARVDELRIKARKRALERYSWTAVTGQYDSLFRDRLAARSS